jgi:hypothetical protein
MLFFSFDSSQETQRRFTTQRNFKKPSTRSLRPTRALVKARARLTERRDDELKNYTKN